MINGKNERRKKKKDTREHTDIHALIAETCTRVLAHVCLHTLVTDTRAHTNRGHVTRRDRQEISGISTLTYSTFIANAQAKPYRVTITRRKASLENIQGRENSCSMCIWSRVSRDRDPIVISQFFFLSFFLFFSSRRGTMINDIFQQRGSSGFLFFLSFLPFALFQIIAYNG